MEIIIQFVELPIKLEFVRSFLPTRSLSSLVASLSSGCFYFIVRCMSIMSQMDDTLNKYHSVHVFG